MPVGLVRYSARMRTTPIGPGILLPSPTEASPTGLPAPPAELPPLPVGPSPPPVLEGCESPAAPPALRPGGPPSELHPAEINQLVADFRRALTDPRIDPRPAGQKLYDILVKPVEGETHTSNNSASYPVIFSFG